MGRPGVPYKEKIPTEEGNGLSDTPLEVDSSFLQVDVERILMIRASDGFEKNCLYWSGQLQLSCMSAEGPSV